MSVSTQPPAAGSEPDKHGSTGRIAGFTPLPATVDLPALEAEVLERWHNTGVFSRSLEQTSDGPRWVFYEGPPTANGKPGTHHVEARVFKDLFPRFKTMKGFHVDRRAGWDCHGLPVELAVEKELGFTSKHDIEAYGVAEFNAKCRESVLRHVDEFERLTTRMGYWTDLEKAYRTMDPDYVESVWWSLQKIFDRGLLVEDHRVAPYCPRCETGLSDHEVAQGYTEVVDPSVYVRFPVADKPYDLLVWTTTPWTLVSNTAVAVHPEVTYVVVSTPAIAAAGTRPVLVAEPLIAKAVGDDAEVIDRIKGADLEGLAYQAPFSLIDIPTDTGAHRIVLAGYVTVEDGTGLVHQAPAFGAEDMAVARTYGLPVVNPIEHDGRFNDEVPLVGGVFFKTADAALVDDLRDRGVLWRYEPYTHTYPLCWRCDTPLLYYALPSWYIRTTAISDRLLEENEKTDWHPGRIKNGRYGEWLRGNVDWALSRNRYWGTPLPIWRCTTDPSHLTCIGSLAELSEKSGSDQLGLDPHRPYVDDVVLPCSQCGDEARRVPEVIDGWYDSGSMPFAQWGAPYRNNEEFEANYPAQYICEGLDQTRGWFYTLMAVGTLVFDKSSYETVLCLGLILDADGRKMSKHLGNVLDPFELFDRHGADAVRWLMLASGSPWSDRRIGHDVLEEIVRKVLLTWWNTAAFGNLYASASNWTPGEVAAPADRPVLDRWALSELQDTITEVDAALESFDSLRAGRRLVRFVDDLSNFYVRRSRRRFWDGDPAALATLNDCLGTLCRLMAPFTPFLADTLWDKVWLAGHPDDVDSVHLAPWPVADPALADPSLGEQVTLARRIIELGRAARAASGVKTRQPLARSLVGAAGFAALSDELRGQIAEELNVLTVEGLTGDLVDVSVKANFRALGKRFGKRTPAVAAAVSEAGRPDADGQLAVRVDGEDLVLGPDELIVTETPREGWSVTSEAGASVALDLEITPELRRAGQARDVIRHLQEGRKRAGLDITDRIEVWWQATDDSLSAALDEHGAMITAEVLAVTFKAGPPPVDMVQHHDKDLGFTSWLRVAGG
jgi:isoleucyl-tRNA synthetase